MAENNSNPSLEMGAGDQVALVATTASKKTILYVVGTVAMLAVLGGIVATIAVVSGGEAEPTVTTTTVVPVDPTTTSEPATPESSTTPAPTTESESTEATTPVDPITTTAATTEATTTDSTTTAATTEATTTDSTTTAATTEATTTDSTTTAATTETTTTDSTTTAATTEATTTDSTTTAATTEATTMDSTTTAATTEATTTDSTTTAATTEATTTDSTTTAATTEATTTDSTTTAATTEATTTDSTTTAATTEATTTDSTTTAATTEATTTDSTTSTTPPTTTDPPITNPPILPLDLEEFITGAYSPSSFNATWTAGAEMFFRNGDGDLVLYDVDADTTVSLIYNETSEILQRSSRVMQFSSDGNEIILAYDDIPMYRHSFHARYAAVNPSTQSTVYISPFTNNAGKSVEVPFLQNFVWSPSGTALAFVYMNDIYYQNNLNTPPRQITTNGESDVIFNGIPDWVYEEEVFSSHNAIWFSKDGAKMAFATFNDTNVRIMKVPHYGVPGSINYQYTQHHSIPYPKTGTTNPEVSVTLFDVNTNDRNVYTAPADYPILKTVKFVTNSTIAVVWTNRVQTQMRVQLCTAGTCSVIFSHNEPNGWIDIVPLFFNDAGTAFITILPRTVEGNLFKQIVQVSQPTNGSTGPEWSNLQNRVNQPHTVLEILSWTSANAIWYKATNVADSAEQHIYTVTSTGTVTCFTCGIQREDGGECLYNEATLSNAGDRITINCAGPGVPQVLIFATNGTLIRVWNDNADLSTITSNRELPTTIRLSVPIVTGLPEADVQIQVPVDYATRTNVPLLVYVYGGPETALVTKKWSLDWGSFLVSQWGIAVAHIDGRGSGLRGVSNMFALNGKLGTVEVADQITVTKYLQDNQPWIDGNRTCIWGWSYGGYVATKALAEGGDVFKCAAAVAPVVDWKLYDTIYTERYMGLPTENAADYAASSLLTEQVADSLRDKSYFLIHGTADDNVHYQHAMLLSRLLQTRNVYFKQMSYTDQNHGLGGVQPHLYHALEKFLQEHML